MKCLIHLCEDKLGKPVVDIELMPEFDEEEDLLRVLWASRQSSFRISSEIWRLYEATEGEK